MKRFSGDRPVRARTRSQNEQGYVLLEALVAAAILTFGLVAIMQVFQKSIQITQERRHFRAPALQVAETLLAELELDAKVPGAMTHPLPSGSEGQFQYVVSNTAWPAAPGLQKIQVTVRWDDRGSSGSLSLTTLLPKNAGLSP